MSGPVTRSDAPVGDPAGSHAATPPCLTRYPSRRVELGGTTVWRALPKRERRTIGAWCFVDHFGGVPDGHGAAMQIGPHPHIGLQTVTWLVDGEVLHHDSLGSEQVIRPGQLNVMTAGRGVAHAEETPPGVSDAQHGAQLWVAQPEATRHGAPAFEHHADLPRIEEPGVTLTVLVGEVAGHRSPARCDTPLVGVAVTAARAGELTVPLDPTFEHGIVVLSGAVLVAGQPVEPGELAYLGRGRDELTLAAPGPTHALVLGGAPFAEDVVMWWNFVARTRDEIAEARAAWMDGDADRFAPVASRLGRIDAPAL
jgi:quercetin 2,3-dioxygenase